MNIYISLHKPNRRVRVYRPVPFDRDIAVYNHGKEAEYFVAKICHADKYAYLERLPYCTFDIYLFIVRCHFVGSHNHKNTERRRRIRYGKIREGDSPLFYVVQIICLQGERFFFCDCGFCFHSICGFANFRNAFAKC